MDFRLRRIYISLSPEPILGTDLYSHFNQVEYMLTQKMLEKSINNDLLLV